MPYLQADLPCESIASILQGLTSSSDFKSLLIATLKKLERLERKYDALLQHTNLAAAKHERSHCHWKRLKEVVVSVVNNNEAFREELARADAYMRSNTAENQGDIRSIAIDDLGEATIPSKGAMGKEEITEKVEHIRSPVRSSLPTSASMSPKKRRNPSSNILSPRSVRVTQTHVKSPPSSLNYSHLAQQYKSPRRSHPTLSNQALTDSVMFKDLEDGQDLRDSMPSLEPNYSGNIRIAEFEAMQAGRFGRYNEQEVTASLSRPEAETPDVWDSESETVKGAPYEMMYSNAQQQCNGMARTDNMQIDSGTSISRPSSVARSALCPISFSVPQNPPSLAIPCIFPLPKECSYKPPDDQDMVEESFPISLPETFTRSPSHYIVSMIGKKQPDYEMWVLSQTQRTLEQDPAGNVTELVRRRETAETEKSMRETILVSKDEADEEDRLPISIDPKLSKTALICAEESVPILFDGIGQQAQSKPSLSPTVSKNDSVYKALPHPVQSRRMESSALKTSAYGRSHLHRANDYPVKTISEEKLCPPVDLDSSIRPLEASASYSVKLINELRETSSHPLLTLSEVRGVRTSSFASETTSSKIERSSSVLGCSKSLLSHSKAGAAGTAKWLPDIQAALKESANSASAGERAISSLSSFGPCKASGYTPSDGKASVNKPLSAIVATTLNEAACHPAAASARPCGKVFASTKRKSRGGFPLPDDIEGDLAIVGNAIVKRANPTTGCRGQSPPPGRNVGEMETDTKQIKHVNVQHKLDAVQKMRALQNRLPQQRKVIPLSPSNLGNRKRAFHQLAEGALPVQSQDIKNRKVAESLRKDVLPKATQDNNKALAVNDPSCASEEYQGEAFMRRIHDQRRNAMKTNPMKYKGRGAYARQLIW